MRTKSIPIMLLIAQACAACSILPEHVNVQYAPSPIVTPVRVSTPAAVQLNVTDARRAESPDWIGDKKNGYGMRLASVLAQRPVADIVRDAITQELSARGITIGSGPNTVSVDVTRFESVYQNRFFTVGAIGYADLLVQVRRADGQIAYARAVSTDNDNQGSIVGTAGQARRSIETALSDVIGQVMSDPAFLAAVQGRGAPPPAGAPVT